MSLKRSVLLALTLLATAGGKVGPPRRLFVAGDKAIRIYDLQAAGNQAPLRRIEGPRTGLDQPQQMAFAGNELFVAQKDAVLVFDLNAEGDAAPLRILRGGKTLLEDAHGLVVHGQEVFVSSTMSDWILVFRCNDQGNVAPRRTIWGPATGLRWPRALALMRGELAVANRLKGQIAFFPLNADGDCPPPQTPDGIHSPNEVAAVGGELLVGDGYGSMVWTFGQNGKRSGLSHHDLLGPSGIAASDQELFLGGFITHRILVYRRNSPDQPARQLRCPDGPHSLLIAPAR